MNSALKFLCIGSLALLLALIGSGSHVEAQVAKKVLMIGIDGAGGRYVTAAHTPNLDALAASGAARYDFLNEGALTPNPPNGYGASGVNWSTFLTGAAAPHHGVVDNSFAGANFMDYPHFFQHVKVFDADLKTISLANWTPINTFITLDLYSDVEIGYDSGSTASQDSELTQDAVSFLTSGRRFGDVTSSPVDPDVLFLHFDQVDGAGHSFSWGSAEHTAAIESVDALIGEVVTALNNRPGVNSGAEDWLILVSADHGAAEGSFGHFASQGLPNWEVPFIVSGPSVEPDTPMQQGSLRDLASTALWHLGVDPFLAGLDGTIRGLTVEPPSGVVGDFNGDGVLFGDGAGPAATDDVTTFLDHWLVSGAGGLADRYGRGDINLDGTTDLSDWALVKQLNPSMGQAIALALGQNIPEPSSFALFATLLAIFPNRSFNRRS